MYARRKSYICTEEGLLVEEGVLVVLCSLPDFITFKASARFLSVLTARVSVYILTAWVLVFLLTPCRLFAQVRNLRICCPIVGLTY